METVNVILSGLDPYEGVELNPSRVVVERLAEEGVAARVGADAGTEGADYGEDILDDVQINIVPVMLPVDFEQSWSMLKNALDANNPNVVVATGLDRSARGMLLERCSVNLMDTSRRRSRADGYSDGLGGDGVEKNHGPIDPDGPAAFWTRLPLRAVLDDFGRDNIPAALSSDAGTFVCNALFYNMMQWVAARKHIVAGFVSLPVIADAPHAQHGLTLDQQIQACRDVVREAVEYYLDPSSSDILIH